jgi:hypothetical protein
MFGKINITIEKGREIKNINCKKKNKETCQNKKHKQ